MSSGCNLDAADRVLISIIVDGCTTRPLFNTSTDPVASTRGEAIDIDFSASSRSSVSSPSSAFVSLLGSSRSLEYQQHIWSFIITLTCFARFKSPKQEAKMAEQEILEAIREEITHALRRAFTSPAPALSPDDIASVISGWNSPEAQMQRMLMGEPMFKSFNLGTSVLSGRSHLPRRHQGSFQDSF
jgi:hypothetical protein